MHDAYLVNIANDLSEMSERQQAMNERMIASMVDMNRMQTRMFEAMMEMLAGMQTTMNDLKDKLGNGEQQLDASVSSDSFSVLNPHASRSISSADTGHE